MQAKSLKINFLLNTSRTLLNFLVPLIIFPYISRVLGPEGNGKVEFANSIVSYFVLFTSLGIPMYGVREIARVRDNEINRSRTFWELTIILLCTVFAGYVVYLIVVLLVPAFRVQWLLFCIVAPNIALSDFSFEWFYQGIENQAYITVRYLLTKIFQIVCVFLFIKSSEHYLRYAAVYVGMNGISALFNISYLRKYVCHVGFSELHPFKHVKSILIIFASIIATSIYMNLDITMLGFFCGDKNVGLYTAANRLVRIVITLVTAFSAVVVPRIENCLANGDNDNYRKYLNLSLHYILFFSLPCCLGLVALSGDIILIFAGIQYSDSVLTMKILSPIVIIVGLAYFVGLQILYPHRKEWKYTVSVTIAAVMNAIFNAIMIPVFAQNGAAFGTIIAEAVGLVLQFFFASEYLKETDLISWNTVKYIIAGILMFIVLSFLPNFQNVIVHLLVSIGISIVVYGLSLLFMREKLSWEVLRKMKK